MVLAKAHHVVIELEMQGRNRFPKVTWSSPLALGKDQIRWSFPQRPLSGTFFRISGKRLSEGVLFKLFFFSIFFLIYDLYSLYHRLKPGSCWLSFSQTIGNNRSLSFLWTILHILKDFSSLYLPRLKETPFLQSSPWLMASELSPFLLFSAVFFPKWSHVSWSTALKTAHAASAAFCLETSRRKWSSAITFLQNSWHHEIFPFLPLQWYS